jgi:hypothetical protein
LEGTNEHVDAVLALYRNPASTKAQFSAAATAAYYAAHAYAATAAYYAAHAYAAHAYAATAAYYAAAYAIVAVQGDKVERFTAELELLLRFAPQQTHDRKEGDQPEND